MDLMISFLAQNKAAGNDSLARLLFLVGFLSLTWSGCAPRAPVLEPVDLPVTPILERLEERRAFLSSVRAAGRLRLDAGEQQWSGRALVLAQFPLRLRLELLSFFGQPVLYVVSNGSEVITWAPGQHASRGFGLGRALATFTNIPLPDDEEALLLLAGCVPGFRYRKAQLFWDPQERALLLHVEGPSRGELERVWLEDDATTVRRLQRLQGGSTRLDATFSEFTKAEGFSYPREVKIEIAGLHITLRYQTFTANDTLSEEVFHLELPPGVEILPR